MKIVIDMNLTPLWADVLTSHGWQAVHWSAVGDPRAKDHEIMGWALANGYIVFTHDLDFGAILAATQAQAPSVIQVRTQDVMPAHLEPVIVAALQQYEAELEAGALVIVHEGRLRVRVLPLQRK
jgi:predicted nuclease of predicted toxin-antitoxin system